VKRQLFLCLAAITLVAAGLTVAADQPPADPEGKEPPVRLKKKNRPALPVPGKDDLDKKPVPEDQPPVDQPDQPDKEKIKIDDGDPDQPDPKEEEAKAVLERVGKNMRLSEDRLDNKELGDGLKSVQQDIVKDLDSLIQHKQQQQQQQSSSGGGGSSGATSSGEPSSGQGSGAPQNGGLSRQQRKQQQQQVARGMRNQPKQQQKGQGSGQLARNNGGSSSQPGNQGGNPTQPPSEKENPGGKLNPDPEQLKAIWGHLVSGQRAEMDSYARDKFMERYDELIRQYYSTLSERSRRGNPDER